MLKSVDFTTSKQRWLPKMPDRHQIQRAIGFLFHLRSGARLLSQSITTRAPWRDIRFLHWIQFSIRFNSLPLRAHQYMSHVLIDIIFMPQTVDFPISLNLHCISDSNHFCNNANNAMINHINNQINQSAASPLKIHQYHHSDTISLSECQSSSLQIPCKVPTICSTHSTSKNE